MKRSISWFLFLCSCLINPLLQAQEGKDVQPDNLFPQVLIETSVGNVLIELDRTRAPITVNNFLAYVVAGHYDGTIFHRVIRDFVVQGGGYDIFFGERPLRPEIYNESGNGLKNQLYTIAMAREKEPHSASAQFFFNMGDNTSLDPGKDWGYTVFGMVMEGSDVLDLISRGQTQVHPQLGWEDVPLKPVVLKKARVVAE